MEPAGLATTVAKLRARFVIKDADNRTQQRMNQPFRWNLAKREQLGKLVHGEAAIAYPQFLADLQECCARVLSSCDNSDLIFVGRSPESIFDHLSGLLCDTSWGNRCVLFNISMAGGGPVAGAELRHPSVIKVLREQFAAVGLAPAQLVVRDMPVAFVDLVSTGGTYADLNEMLFAWTREVRADEPAARRKLRYVGITVREKTSPKTWRWQQHAAWTCKFRSHAIKNVSVPWRLWDYLGNRQQKVTPSNPRWRWGSDELAQVPRAEHHLQALRLALKLYDQGLSVESRRRLSTLLARQPAMTEGWFRTLVNELRTGSGR